MYSSRAIPQRVVVFCTTPHLEPVGRVLFLKVPAADVGIAESKRPLSMPENDLVDLNMGGAHVCPEMVKTTHAEA